MKALVTGGKGFIGSNIVEHLTKLDWKVIVIDDESAPENEIFYEFPDVQYIKDSILEKSTHKLYAGVDFVFHCAARSRIQPSIVGDSDECFYVNTLGTQSVCEASRVHKVEKIIYSASSSIYGNKNVLPFNTSMSPDCLNPYSLSKKMGEDMLELYYNMWELPYINLRYFNVYGPREPLKGQYAPVIGLFKRQVASGKPMTIVGDGRQRRDFTYVADVVEANLKAAFSSITHGTYNVGTGKSYSINELASIIGNDIIYISPRPAEIRETRADITSTISDLDWQPKKELEEAILCY
tara:strand:+ start:1782 stop:2666 length:885 start_codon:yes stop_codon:yes gene_type:complete